MAWDKDLPDGDASIALGDDVIRANNTALESALDLEHRFTTAGNQSGRHHFANDSNVNIGALGDLVEGSIAFSNDQVTATNPTLMVHKGGVFVPADCGVANIPRKDSQSQFTVCQFTDIHTITLATGAGPAGQDEAIIDLNQSSYQKINMASNKVYFGGFSNDVASHVTTVQVEMVQNGTGGFGINFDSSIFVAALSLNPIIGLGPNKTSVIYFSKLSSGLWLVSSSTQLGPIS